MHDLHITVSRHREAQVLNSKNGMGFRVSPRLFDSNPLPISLEEFSNALSSIRRQGFGYNGKGATTFGDDHKTFPYNAGTKYLQV